MLLLSHNGVIAKLNDLKRKKWNKKSDPVIFLSIALVLDDISVLGCVGIQLSLNVLIDSLNLVVSCLSFYTIAWFVKTN